MNGKAQVTFFSENVGAPATTTAIATYTGWQNEAPVTFTGDADVRKTQTSIGKYPAASGEGNVFITNTIGRNLTISGINTSQYSNIVLKVGHYKSTLLSSNELVIEVSTDGINYTPLTYTRNTGNGTADWIEIIPTGAIPSTSNLRIRFRQPSSPTAQFRIDDIRLIGDPNPCDVTVTSFSPVTGPAGTEVTINGTNFTGATEVRFNGLPQAIFEYISPTQIKARVPIGATTGPITVFTDCGGTSTVDFAVIDLDCPYSGSGLIISELCDPKDKYQTDRYIEIYNPGNTTVNLTGWEVRSIANGSITANCSDQFILCWPLSGFIEPGEALTCGYTNPVNGGPHDFTSPKWTTTDVDQACFNWNGQERDGAALYNGGVRIDAILKGNTNTNYYPDKSLIRNSDICSPNPNSPTSEWTVTTTVTIAGSAPSTPRSHQSDCAISSPQIDTHPIDQSICATETITLIVAASGGMPAFIYKWKVYTGSGNWQYVTNGGNYSGANAASLTITNTPASFDGYQYYCEVYNNDNSCFKASNAAIISVSPKPTPSPIWHY